MSYYLSFNCKELQRMNARRMKAKKTAGNQESSVARDVETVEGREEPVQQKSEKRNCQKKLLPQFVEAARTEDERRASSTELFIRREEQISRGSNVAVEILERKAEKRRASCQSQVPSKVNKMDGMLHVRISETVSRGQQ